MIFQYLVILLFYFSYTDPDLFFSHILRTGSSRFIQFLLLVSFFFSWYLVLLLCLENRPFPSRSSYYQIHVKLPSLYYYYRWGTFPRRWWIVTTGKTDFWRNTIFFGSLFNIYFWCTRQSTGSFHYRIHHVWEQLLTHLEGNSH